MAKNRLVKENEKIAQAVTGGYKKIEDGVVGGYQKIEDTVVGGFTRMTDAFVDQFLTRDGETVADAKARLAAEEEARRAAKDRPGKPE